MSIEGDGPEVYHETRRRARREHTCCACRYTIRVGDRYATAFALYEGMASTWKWCLRCKAILDHLNSLREPGSDWGPDAELSCGHSYEDMWGKAPPPEIAALAFCTADEMQRRVST